MVRFGWLGTPGALRLSIHGGIVDGSRHLPTPSPHRSCSPAQTLATNKTPARGMAWYDEDSWATAAFAPRPATIVFTFLLVVLLPILLHQCLYSKVKATTLPTFLLMGPSGGGKTALLTLVCPSYALC